MLSVEGYIPCDYCKADNDICMVGRKRSRHSRITDIIYVQNNSLTISTPGCSESDVENMTYISSTSGE